MHPLVILSSLLIAGSNVYLAVKFRRLVEELLPRSRSIDRSLKVLKFEALKRVQGSRNGEV